MYRMFRNKRIELLKIAESISVGLMGSATEKGVIANLYLPYSSPALRARPAADFTYIKPETQLNFIYKSNILL